MLFEDTDGFMMLNLNKINCYRFGLKYLILNIIDLSIIADKDINSILCSGIIRSLKKMVKNG